MKILVFTGAGVSGLRRKRDSDFPGPLIGLWEQYEATDIASRAAFRKNKAMVWSWFEWLRSRVLKAMS